MSDWNYKIMEKLFKVVVAEVVNEYSVPENYRQREIVKVYNQTTKKEIPYVLSKGGATIKFDMIEKGDTIQVVFSE